MAITNCFLIPMITGYAAFQRMQKENDLRMQITDI